jgi:pimeloyl-ACP methyl ester carboxylesterase
VTEPANPASVPESDDAVAVHDVAVAGTDAYLVEPRAGGRGAAVLYLHWFDTEADDGNRTQFVSEAMELAREHGVVSIHPQGCFPWAQDPAGAAADARRIRDEVARHRAAVDFLASRSDVDRIALVGHDFGAMHGIVLAADEPRLTAAVLIAATPRWGDWFLPFWQIDGDWWDYGRALEPLDPITRIGDLAPRPVLLQFARADFFIAPMSGMGLHRAAGETAEMKAYDTDHAMRDSAALRDRRAFLTTHLRLGG